MLEKIKQNKKWVILATSAFLIIFLIASGGKDDEPEFQTAFANRGDIVEEVSVTGRVEPSKRVDLAFERTGKVSRVHKDVGDSVSAGEIIVQLESTDLYADLTQAEARVKVEKAKLSNLLAGSRSEEVNVQKTKVENAKIAISEIESSIEVVLEAAYSTVDDAIHNKTDQFLSNPNGPTPELNLSITNNQLERDIESTRVTVQGILEGWVRPLPSSTHRSSLEIVKGNLEIISNYLNKVATAVNSLSLSAALTQTTIDGYKTSVSTTRTTINTQISTLAGSLEKLTNAEAALDLALKQLTLTEAPPTKENVDAQNATVEASEAAMHNLQAQLGKTMLRSPISGVVTEQEAKVGEIVVGGVSLVSIITSSAFKIEAVIPEADIANIAIGNQAKVTLDAYREDVIFHALVSRIDPAETIIAGVATYKTTLEFKENDERILSGMTANVDILTNERKDVIYIPSRAVLGTGNQKIVRVVDGDSYNEVIVATGIRGVNGNIEITDGLEEGDEVVVFILD